MDAFQAVEFEFWFRLSWPEPRVRFEDRCYRNATEEDDDHDDHHVEDEGDVAEEGEFVLVDRKEMEKK